MNATTSSSSLLDENNLYFEPAIMENKNNNNKLHLSSSYLKTNINKNNYDEYPQPGDNSNFKGILSAELVYVLNDDLIGLGLIKTQIQKVLTLNVFNVWKSSIKNNKNNFVYFSNDWTAPSKSVNFDDANFATEAQALRLFIATAGIK